VIQKRAEKSFYTYFVNSPNVALKQRMKILVWSMGKSVSGMDNKLREKVFHKRCEGYSVLTGEYLYCSLFISFMRQTLQRKSRPDTNFC
jgi:hypothetical protein